MEIGWIQRVVPHEPSSRTRRTTACSLEQSLATLFTACEELDGSSNCTGTTTVWWGGGGGWMWDMEAVEMEQRQRGHVELEWSQWWMQSTWKTCLQEGTCTTSSFSSNSPKQTQHLWNGNGPNEINYCFCFSHKHYMANIIILSRLQA